MSQLLKWTIAFFVVAGLLTAAYLYSQPLCGPCRPGYPCPPCISDTQIVIKWIDLTLVALYFAYLIYTILTKHLKWVTG